MGNKIAIGFVILLIIWGLEVFAEDGKLAKMESIQRGEISESEHLSCQQGESFDMEICLDEMQQDAIDDQRVVVWIAIFEIIAWFIVFLGLLEIAQKIMTGREMVQKIILGMGKFGNYEQNFK